MTDADTIKAALVAADTPEAVEAVAAQYRDDVRAMARSDSQHDRTMAVQIINLKEWVLRRIGE